ncbi:MAG: hypothetical protein AAF092_13410 [Pseudomonadota bacterium]
MVSKTVQELSLSSKHKRQLQRALERESNKFAECYILPALEAYLDGSAKHLPHIFRTAESSFLEKQTDRILDDHDDDVLLAQLAAGLFTNPLGLAKVDQGKRIPGQHSGGTPPSQRIANDGWWVLTFEVDAESQAELEAQLDWFSGKPENCEFGSVHEHFSRYADYRGYCAVFSGNKSLHIHTLWSIEHLDKAQWSAKTRHHPELYQGDVIPAALGPLHRHLWAEAAKVINAALGTTLVFDARLSSYVQKRRMPNGTRYYQGEPNLHGFKTGDSFPQIVVQEHVSRRAFPRASVRTFATVEAANELYKATPKGRSKPSNSRIAKDGEPELLASLADYLRGAWGEYPKPVSLSYNGEHNEVFFKNDAADTHPNSYMRGDYRRLLPAGRGAPKSALFLPGDLTLDETLQLIVPEDSNVQVERGFDFRHRLRGPVGRFMTRASNTKTTQARARQVFRESVWKDGLSFVQAPEGSGKTHALFEWTPDERRDEDAARYDSARMAGVEPAWVRGLLVYTFADYAAIKDKRVELDDIAEKPNSAVVLRSVSDLYSAACADLGITQRISTEEAGRRGYRCRLEAVMHLQPDVYAKMRVYRDDAWRLPSTGAVAFNPNATVFMVHALFQNWDTSFFNRAFLHPEFSDAFDPDTVQIYRNQMAPWRCVYDEVTANDLIDVVKEWQVVFAQKVASRVRADTGKEWTEAPLAGRVAAFDAEVSAQSRAGSVDFESVDGLIRSNPGQQHRVVLNTDVFHFGKGSADKNIYNGCHGEAYFCIPRRWLTKRQCPMVVITAEDLPRLVMEHLKRSEATMSGTRIINLSVAPYLSQDIVPLMFTEESRSPRGPDPYSDEKPNVVTLADDLLRNAGFDFVISNHLQGIDPSFDQQTSSHAGVRGRNDLAGQRIGTIVTYPSVEQFAGLIALGTYIDLPSVVKVAYRDMIYQDLGRNLGFRRKTGQSIEDHCVFIKDDLFRDLGRLNAIDPDRPSQNIPGAAYDRYQFQLV